MKANVESLKRNPRVKMSTKVGKWKLISRYVRAPFNFLIRARNFYVKSFSDCAENVSAVSNHATVGLVGYPTSPGFPTYLQSTFSSSVIRNSNDFRDLIRTASSTSRTCGQKGTELGLLREKQSKQSPLAMRRAVISSSTVVPRSRTSSSTFAVFGRIDENEPYDDLSAGEDIKLMADHVFPRSRSHAITNRRAFRNNH